MKWEDTVTLCSDEHCQPFCHKTQSKLSFKVGQKEGFAEGCIKTAQRLTDERRMDIIASIDIIRESELQKAKQEGRREVVKWVDKDGYLVDLRATNLGDIPVFLCHSERWQDKKKEWGLKDG